MYGYNDFNYILRKQGVACKAKEQHLNSEAQGNLANGRTSTLHKKNDMKVEIMWIYLKATTQDISQKVKIWLQKGLEN